MWLGCLAPSGLSGPAASTPVHTWQFYFGGRILVFEKTWGFLGPEFFDFWYKFLGDAAALLPTGDGDQLDAGKPANSA
jgi:hypothetical protein